MQPLITVLLLLAKGIGILLLTVLGLVLLVLLALWAIPASVWLSYQEEAFVIQVGALGKKFALYPRPEKPEKPQKPRKPKKAKKPKPAKPVRQTARRQEKPVPAEQKAQKEKPAVSAQPAAEPVAKPAAAKAEPVGGVRFASGAAPHIGQAQPKAKPKPKPEPQPKPKPEPTAETKPQPEPEPKAKLTFDQVVTAVRGAGTFGKRVLAALRVTHIRIYLPVTGADAAETALNYGKAQAWLHGGLAVLNRAVWLEFEECRLEADFLEKGDKKPHFSCQISARLLIIGIAAFRFGWLLWKQDILGVLLAQLSGDDQ